MVNGYVHQHKIRQQDGTVAVQEEIWVGGFRRTLPKGK